MTKKELLQELEGISDDTIVLLDEWCEGIFVCKNIQWVYAPPHLGIVRLHPTDDPYEDEKESNNDNPDGTNRSP